MGNSKRGPLLAAAMAGVLTGCMGSPEDRINAAVPVGKELELARAAFDAAATESKADTATLEADYKAQMKIRALECSRGVEPSMFSSKDSIRKEINNDECFKAADAKLLAWLGLRRIGWLAAMPPLHPLPAQPAGLFAGAGSLTGYDFADEAGVAVLMSGSDYVVLNLDGTQIRKGTADSVRTPALSPNGRLLLLPGNEGTRVVETDSGEVLATLTDLRAARVLWAGDKGLVYTPKEGGGVAYRDLASGVQTVLPMSTYYVSAVVRVSPTAQKYLLFGQGRLGTLELAPDGQGMKPTLSNEVKLEMQDGSGSTRLSPAYGAVVFSGRNGFSRVRLSDLSVETIETAPLRVTSVVPTTDADHVLLTIHGNGQPQMYSYSFSAKTASKVDAGQLLSSRLLYLPSLKRNAEIDGAKIVLRSALLVAGAPEPFADIVHKVKFEQQLAQLEAMDRMQAIQQAQQPQQYPGSTLANRGVGRNSATAPAYGGPGPAARFASGQAGLSDAVRAGVLRPGGPGDLDAWKMAYMTKNQRMPGKSFDEHTKHTPVYVITGNMTIPSDLDGANSVIFVVGRGAPYPQGRTNHSPILDLSSGACTGATCGMFLRD